VEAQRRISRIRSTSGFCSGYALSSIQYNAFNSGGHGLTYTYDAAGNRVLIGSDWARTGLPAAMSSATYDAVDELKSWNGVALPALAFDNGGKLWHDGANTYAWNVRQQLTGITVTATGASVASFTYDASGRRASKTVGGVTTNFLYDGLNPVQELVGGTVTANLLTGLGIDEVFRRSATSGNSPPQRSFFPDALGSTVALTDDTGALQTQYRYEPFGQESLVSGSSTDSNPYQFTARANDGTGLYYYRARYYNPTWGRFISEDPLGDARALNRYAYVGGSPIMYVDPIGLARCTYSISEHVLFCISDDGTRTGQIGPDGIFSGLGSCKNNPACVGESNRGPTPPDTYSMESSEKYNGSYWLNPGFVERQLYKLNLVRGEFYLHKGTYSEGCITVDKNNPEAVAAWSLLGDLLRRDLHNTLKVTP
jgi:RHS repeat-associated protein